MKYLILLGSLLIQFSGVAKAKNTIDIGLLFDNSNEITDQLLPQMQAQIRAVVGEDAQVRFPAKAQLINHFDLAQAKANYQQLLNSDVDLIIAFGVVNNEVVSRQTVHRKPTILFGALNQDIYDFDPKQATSGIKNYTFLVQSESFRQDLSRFKQLVDFKKVGIVIERNIIDLLPFAETFTQITAELGATHQLIPYDTVDDIVANLDGVDAVYLVSGFFLLPAQVEQLAQALVEHKLPSFTIVGVNQVEQGIMATNQPTGDIERFFRRIALTVEGFVNGRPLSQMPVLIENSSQLTINYNTAEAVGVSMKYSLIDTTDFVGEMNNAISQKQYNLLEVIQQAIRQNSRLQSAQRNLSLREQQLKTARNNYLPSVNLSARGTQVDRDTAAISGGNNPEYSSTGTVSLSQTLFSEAANASIDIQRHLLAAETESYLAQELDLVLEAINAYFSILTLKSNAQVQLQNLKLTNENLKLAEQSFEVGQSSKSDVLRFTSEKAQNTQAMVEAANQLEQGFINLNQLLNNDMDYEIDIKDVALNEGLFEKFNFDYWAGILDDPALTQPFITFLSSKAKEFAPELKSIDHNILATQRDYRLNGARRFIPTVALQGQYNRILDRGGVGDLPPLGGSLLDDNHSLALTFSVPLFDGNRYSTNRQIAAIQEEQLNWNRQTIEQNIEANVRRGVFALINQMSNIKLSKVSEESAKESLALTQNAYANGAVNIVQLIDAQNNYINAQLARNNAVYNFLISSLQMERYVGRFFLLHTPEDNERFMQTFYQHLDAHQAKQN